MLILADIPAADPQTHIQATASPGLWQPAAVILAACIAAFVGQYIAHRLNEKRDRHQRLRDAYGEFGAAAFRYLRIASDLVGKYFTIDCHLSIPAPASDEDAHAREYDKFQEEADATRARQQDALHVLREMQCKLVLLLGKDREAVKELEAKYQAIKEIKYQNIPGITQPMPSEEKKKEGKVVKEGGRLEGRLNYLDRLADHNNMRADVQQWLSELGEQLA